MVQTSNQWILERTGISERHIAEPDVATSDLATCAARIALDQRGVDAQDLDCILVCTVTPDMLFPSTACLVQHKLGAKGAWGFDLIAACSGFLYGLTADDVALMIPHQANRRIIAATAERLGLPFDKIIVNIDRYGNTTAGTIPLATRDALSAGRLTKGDLVLFAAVGAGYTVGAALWRWAY